MWFSRKEVLDHKRDLQRDYVIDKDFSNFVFCLIDDWFELKNAVEDWQYEVKEFKDSWGEQASFIKELKEDVNKLIDTINELEAINGKD